MLIVAEARTVLHAVQCNATVTHVLCTWLHGPDNERARTRGVPPADDFLWPRRAATAALGRS